MKWTKNIIKLVIVATIIGCGNQQKEPMKPSDYVEQASFKDFEGNTVNISAFKGKVVLIDFWETWCGPCLDSFPTMQKLVEKYPEDFVVLAVTPGFIDTKEDAQTFISKHNYDFVYLLDSNKLHQKLGVQGIPYKVYVDPQGNYIKSMMGSNGPEADFKNTAEIIKEHNSDSSGN